ncbi:hypothetical protein HDU92_005834 [Lobulomyces angularis]|nr:hypothetical protein HDU92_005834 [Lobulomyces angularis]
MNPLSEINNSKQLPFLLKVLLKIWVCSAPVMTLLGVLFGNKILELKNFDQLFKIYDFLYFQLFKNKFADYEQSPMSFVKEKYFEFKSSPDNLEKKDKDLKYVNYDMKKINKYMKNNDFKTKDLKKRNINFFNIKVNDELKYLTPEKIKNFNLNNIYKITANETEINSTSKIKLNNFQSDGTKLKVKLLDTNVEEMKFSSCIKDSIQDSAKDFESELQIIDDGNSDMSSVALAAENIDN